MVHPGNLPRPVATDLVRVDATGLAEALNPQNSRADANVKLRCSLMARQAATHHTGNDPFLQINSNRPSPSMLASRQSAR